MATEGQKGAAGGLYGKRTVQIQSKAGADYSLTVHDGMVVLMPQDPRDNYQHWVKDGRFGDKVKDAQGNPSFALVNEATGLAIRHATGATRPVQLVPYNRQSFDETVLWTEVTVGYYRAIRMVTNTNLYLGTLPEVGNRVGDGTLIGLTQWGGRDNQQWEMTYK